MHSLTGVVKHYDWGSLDAIPTLLRRSEDGTPWAEYWLGAHNAGPAMLAQEDTRLDTWLLRNPDSLGASEREAFGDRLPYLLKVLAANEPLSLQAHPSRAEAKAGFAAEEARGVAIDDPDRNFKDDWPKPELIVALTPFEALSGFRKPSETLELFSALGVEDDIIRPTFGPLRFRGGAAALAEVFLDCLTLDGTRLDILNQVLAAAVHHTDDAGDIGRFARLAIMLDEYHPGDPSLLAALLLNHVELAPGEALHNRAGVIHSYLRGTGIEIMANSDNVLRAGLTNKHVDHAALATIVDFSPEIPIVLSPEPDGIAAWRYPTDDMEFELWRLQISPDIQAPLPGIGRARLALVIEGQMSLHTSQTMELLQGDAVFIGADESPTMTGDGTAFLAGPGV